MTVTVSMRGVDTIVVRGVDLSVQSKAWWRKQAALLARECVQYIAWLWGQGKTGTGQVLKANSARYTAWKIRNGLDPRPGIATRKLWHFMQRSRVNLYHVGPVVETTRGASITITLNSERVHAAIHYLQYYLNLKAGRIRLIMRLSQQNLDIVAAQWLALVRAEVALANMSRQRLLPGRSPGARDLATRSAVSRAADVERRRLLNLTPGQRRMVSNMLRVRIP